MTTDPLETQPPTEREPHLRAAPSDCKPSLTHEELNALVRAVQETGDRDAFSTLFRHFAPRVKGYLVGLGTPLDTADDLAQESMVTLWRRAASFDPERGALSTWVFTIARNLRIDLHRRTTRLDSAMELPGDPGTSEQQLPGTHPGPDELLHSAQLQHRVRDALAQLPAEQRMLLKLTFFDERPQSGIARQLGVPLNTVKTRLRRAVAQLRRHVDQL